MRATSRRYQRAASPGSPWARFLHDQLEFASPDLLRSMLTTFINAVRL